MGVRAREVSTEIGDHRLGFESLADERSIDELPVEGVVPPWLAGSLLRTGPAKFEVGGQGYRHWFDGLAMLHRFSFAGGRVGYANRFLRSPAYCAAAETGRIHYSEFATDPCRSLFRRVVAMFSPPTFGNNANVAVDRLGDDFVALTETPLPVVFDPATLETLGVGAPAPGQLTVAHPHTSPATAERVSYATHFGPRSSYVVYADNGERRRTIAKLATSRPAYMHSFAITERYVVLVEFPLVVVPIQIPLAGRPFIENYRWRPGRGTTFLAFDLGTGAVRRATSAEPCFAFHHVNAFEREDELVVDLCAYEDAEIVEALYLDRLRRETPDLPDATLRRFRVRLDTGTVSSERLSDTPIELPRIDYERRNGRPYAYVYGIGRRRTFSDELVKVSVEGGGTTRWHEPGTYPGEPVFVPAPGAEDEDDGVLLSVGLDARSATSCLLVLDARDLSELGRAAVPHGIPFGFHGRFFAALDR